MSKHRLKVIVFIAFALSAATLAYATRFIEPDLKNAGPAICTADGVGC